MRLLRKIYLVPIIALLYACQTSMHMFDGNVPQMEQALDVNYGGSVHDMMADSQHTWLVFNYLYRDRYDLLSHMYQKGLDVDWSQAQVGATPLAMAFNHEDLTARDVGFLLNHGASIKRAENDAGSEWAALTPLEAAVQRNSTSFMRHALLAGATKFEGREGDEGKLAALQAVQDYGNWVLAEFMNRQGIDNGLKRQTQTASISQTTANTQQIAEDDNADVALIGTLAGALIGQTVGGAEGEVFSQAFGVAMAAGDSDVLTGAAGILGATGIPGIDSDAALLAESANLLSQALAEQEVTATETSSSNNNTTTVSANTGRKNGTSQVASASMLLLDANPNLPAETQRDILVLEISKNIKQGNKEHALSLFERLNKLPVPVDRNMGYFWGKSLIETGRKTEGIKKLSRYVEKIDEESPYYQPTLRLIAEAQS